MTVEQGTALAKELGVPFIECSALKNENIEEMFSKLLANIEGIDLNSNTSGSKTTCIVM